MFEITLDSFSRKYVGPGIIEVAIESMEKLMRVSAERSGLLIPVSTILATM